MKQPLNEEFRRMQKSFCGGKEPVGHSACASQYNEDGGPRKFEVNAREYMHGSEHQYEANQGNGDAKKHAAPVPLFLILLVGINYFL